MTMRLITYRLGGGKHTRVGIHLGKQVFDLSRSLGVNDMRSLLQGGPNLLTKAYKTMQSSSERVSLSDIQILPPISNPEKILCVGLNYRDHAVESNMEIPTEPVIFSKLPSCIIGSSDKVVKPSETSKLDYEAELVIVIGTEGRRIKESDALKHVAGWMNGNDISARDWQLTKPNGQWLLGKSFDCFAPIGPYIVTKVPDVNNLGIRCLVNGEPLQKSNTREMIFKPETLISYISNIMTLKPGDLIFTGTPPGVGMGRKPPLFLKAGDKVVVEIDELGSLENDIVD